MAQQQQFNFFSWVRDGIKQAVLLGVSDAVEQIGSPMDGDELNNQLGEALAITGGGRGRGGSKRKRLGRTLKDIDTATEEN